jgi:hypothetical protein
MATKGQFLYKYAENDCVYYLEKVTLLNPNNFCDGATVPTYLCRDENGRRFICSREMYSETEEQAWNKCLVDCETALIYYENQLKDMGKLVRRLKLAIPTIKANKANCRP